MDKKRLIYGVLLILVLAIGIAGFWKWKTAQKNEVFEDQTSESVGEKDWKTYRNEEYGFEFKYPSFLYINDQSGLDGGGINFHDQNIEKGARNGALLMSVHVEKYPKLNLEEKLKKETELMRSDLSFEKMTIDNIPAIKFKIKGNSQSSGIDSVFVIKDDRGVTLNISVDGVPNISEKEDEIISSFKFIK